jgi:3-oxoacyl-(acyl-carrier-protein) synthase
MQDIIIIATSKATAADLPAARLGVRFGRLDLLSQLALLAVESLSVHFESMPRDRIGICLAAPSGSLSTDFEYWKGRDSVGGPSPTLFAYTLPSAAIGEIAIRHRITGPNLCFVGGAELALAEATDLVRRSEVEGCLCVTCNSLSEGASELIHGVPAAEACAHFLTRKGTAYGVLYPS